MELIIFSRYTASQASTRVRFLQYIPALTDVGFKVEIFPILVDASIFGRSGLLSSVGSRIKSFGHIALRLLRDRRHEIAIHIHFELFPWLPYFLERCILLLAGKKKYTIELDDAWFHSYDENKSPIIRFIFGKKIDKLMRHSTLVIAGNEYIAGRARRAGAPRVEVVPTVVNVDRYQFKDGFPSQSVGFGPALAEYSEKTTAADSNTQVIGWIGSPSTTKFLVSIGDVLKTLSNDGIAEFVAIGADLSELGDLPVRVIPWNESTETLALHRINIGIMPLSDSLFSRGKCGYKLVQYMACGLPVVASPIGVNTSIVVHGETGFLASTQGEWYKYLSLLCNDASLRRRLGQAGFERAEEHYSLRVTAPRVASIMKSVWF
jgi:glycosyltransferase involved in cell wall biosynthesis